MADYLGHRPNRYTIVLTRGAAFVQRFEVIDTPLPEGTTSWIAIYDTEDELLTIWHPATTGPSAVEYLIEPHLTAEIGYRTRAAYNLYLNYPGSRLPYCWFRGPIIRED
ncbi:LtfC-like domain-containing protein [Nocardia xishanensis]